MQSSTEYHGNKKTFLSDQCKEIEENNRMGKTISLFRKVRDTKGSFHAKMGIIKDRNSMNLKEEENVKMRWQEHTEELYKKHCNDSDNHDCGSHLVGLRKHHYEQS